MSLVVKKRQLLVYSRLLNCRTQYYTIYHTIYYTLYHTAYHTAYYTAYHNAIILLSYC